MGVGSVPGNAVDPESVTVLVPVTAAESDPAADVESGPVARPVVSMIPGAVFPALPAAPPLMHEEAVSIAAAAITAGIAVNLI